MLSLIFNFIFVLAAVNGGAVSRLRLNDEIIGGDEVSVYEYPHQANIIWKLLEWEHCGASIISEDYVLTSAICADFMENKEDFKIIIGNVLPTTGGLTYDIDFKLAHSKFNYDTLDYDVALIKSKTKMTLNGVTTKAVQLAEEEIDLIEGDNVVMTGWGCLRNGSNSNSLQAVTIPIVNREYCQEALKNSQYPIQLTERMFCVGSSGVKGACDRDFGGPVVSESSLVQYGIVSLIYDPRTTAKIPNVITSVPRIRGWIKEVTGI